MSPVVLPKYLERSEPDFLRVALDGSVTVDRIDQEICAALSGRADYLSAWRGLTFDFSDATFIEPAALQCLVGQIRALLELRAPVMVRIPKSKRVRDFMRLWRVNDAFYQALGYSLAALAPAEDRRYFTEEQTHYTEFILPEYVRKTHVITEADKVLPENFYAFHMEDLSGMRLSSRLAYAEEAHWKHDYMLKVIEKKLGPNYTYFPSRVVFESFLNAIRHPNARIIMTATIDPSLFHGTKKSGMFTVVFWDDGDGMGHTLMRGKDRGFPIQRDVDSDLHRRFLVVTSEDDKFGTPGPETTSIVSSTLGADMIEDEASALVAMLFPGITSSPYDAQFAVADEVTAADPRFAERGMGLYVLMRTTVDVFGGSVAFRTGDCFVNVRALAPKEKSVHDADFRVRIHRRHNSLPSFVGNMVTIRLPAK